MTFDRDDDHFSGALSIGDRNRSYGPYRGPRPYPHSGGRYGDWHRYGGGYYYGYYRPYAAGHYYRHYRPAYLPRYGYYYCTPRYGYTFASVYYYEPYVTRIYDDAAYYVVRDYETYPSSTTVIVDDGSTTYASAEPVEATQAPTIPAQPSAEPFQEEAEQYQPLVDTGWGPVLGEGNAAFATGRYEEARRLYVRAVLADERDGYAKMLYAWANFALGDYEVAASAARRALLTSPDLMEFPIDLRTLYSDPLTFEAHVNRLVYYTTDHPEERDAGFLLAYLHYSVGEPARALAYLAGLPQAGPEDTLAALLYDAALRASRLQTED